MACRKHSSLVVVKEGETSLGGRVVPYRVKRSSRARQVRLEMRRESGLSVVIPRTYSLGHVTGLIREKQRWILGNLAKYDQGKPRPTRWEIRTGDVIPYLGGLVTVVTEESCDENIWVRLEQNKLVASLAGGSKKLSVILEQWYRLQAANIMAEKVAKWSAVLGVRYSRITIRGQRTRWGSCSCRGNLSFNWKLLMAPEPVIDYVVIHELSHLREMNHSNRFWQLVNRYCSGWLELKNWLEMHEADLAAGLLVEPAYDQ